MVVSGGVNIYPAEAEQILIDHPEVADIGCIGIPHQDLGEELVALIVQTDPTSQLDCRRNSQLVARQTYSL